MKASSESSIELVQMCTLRCSHTHSYGAHEDTDWVFKGGFCPCDIILKLFVLDDKKIVMSKTAIINFAFVLSMSK